IPELGFGIDQVTAGGGDHLTRCKPGEYLDHVATPRPDRDLARRKDAWRCFHPDNFPPAVIHDRGMRHCQAIAERLPDLGLNQHLRLEFELRVGQHDPHLDGPGLWVEEGIDERYPAA